MKPADILTDLLRVRGDIDRLVDALTPHLRDTGRDLLIALHDATGGAAFTAAEAWDAADHLRRASAAEGQPLPDMCALLDAAGIYDTADLGRWMARQETGVQRAPKTRHGVIWQIVLRDAA